MHRFNILYLHDEGERPMHRFTLPLFFDIAWGKIERHLDGVVPLIWRI